MITSATGKRAVLGLLLGAAILSVLVMPFAGIMSISPGDVLGGTTGSSVFWNIRVARVITAFLAGAALSLSGMTFQAIFRNPLATPFTLGVANGAALGAALSIWLGLGFSVLGFSGDSVFAFLGAGGAILLVYGLTRLRRGLSTLTMLLAGVAVGAFCSSIILFIQYMSDFTQSFQIIRWLMGGLEVVGYGPLLNMLPFVLGGAVVILFLSQELNLMVTGEEIAVSRGVDVRRTRLLAFLATSVMVGGVVAVCGPIGFVGMMAPHICRLVLGEDHRYLAPASLLFGGLFLLLCDTLARTIIAPAEIPVGVITSLLGGPFFIWLLMGRNRLGL